MEKIEIIHNWLNIAIDKQDMNPITLLKINLEELSELAVAMGLKEEFKQLLINQINNMKEISNGSVIDALVDMEWTKHNISYLYDIDKNQYNKHFSKVTESNFSKFCFSQEEADLTIEKYKNQGIETYCKKRGKYYVVYRKDGKILKSINYKKEEEI